MKRSFRWSLWIISLICCIQQLSMAQINTPSGAVVPFGANPSYQYGIMPTNLPTGGTYGRSQDAANAYNEWKSSYVASCPSGFRVRFDDPSRTVSEGIAYGMLLSAYAADKALFDGLWAYYKANSNSRGIMHWRIDGCSGVSGNNGATDAELDAAYALLIAENQWPTLNSPYDYNAEANALIDRVRQWEIHPSSFQTINGDGWGFADNCRNPSYQSPAYYRFFATQRPGDAGVWNNAINASYSLLAANAHPTTGLVSDWCNQNGVRNTCNGSPIGLPTDGYGYDACRNPWRMAQEVIWHDNATARGYCNRMAAYVASRGVSNVRGPLYQDGSLYPGNQANATFVSTFAMSIMGSVATNQTLMNDMYTRVVSVKDQIQNVTLSGYFGNTLRCLSLFMMTGNFWKPGTTSQQDINIREAALDIPSGSTYDFQNVIQSGNKVATFTVENKGFNTLNLTGSPRIAISGPNAALFTINQTSVGASLAGNTSTTFTVTFAPGSTGVKTATISIASNDPNENPYTINLTGTGTLTATASKIEVTYNGNPVSNNGPNIALGTISATSNQTLPFVVRNTGDAPLNITSIVASGTGYSLVAPLPTIVAIGATDTVWVRINSATAAALNGFITINNDDVTAPAFRVNLSTTVAACGSAITVNKVFQDFDGNYANTALAFANTAWTELVRNPYESARNSSYYVARHVRPALGDYNGVRYVLCGTTNNVNITASDNIISMLVYSPVPGVPVLMNLKTDADVANTTTYPSRSSVTVTTTKVNQWERIYFDHSAAIGATGIRHIELFIDPLRTKGAQTYLVDDIKLDIAACIADIPASGILNDFDNHRNLAYPFPPSGTWNDVIANPSTVGINTTAGAAQWIRPATGIFPIIRFSTCGILNLSAGKTIISMMVYSPQPGVPVIMSLKNGTSGTPTEVSSVTLTTTRSNQWERMYFDFTAIQGNTTVRAIDLFIDPNAAFVSSAAARTYYIDEIRYADQLPCVTGIPATRILNDYDNNRNLDLAFLPVGTFNDVRTNPFSVGINTSATVAEYVRPASTTADVIRYKSCGNNLDLGSGKTVLSFLVYSRRPGTVITMSLKNAGGTAVSDVNVTTTATNAWEEVIFDHSAVLNNTTVRFIDLIIDPTGAYTATPTDRTYFIDNLKYSDVPRMEVRYNTTRIASNTTPFNMGGIAVGSSSSELTFTIINNGLNDLILNGTPNRIQITGTDAAMFTIDQTQTNSPVTSGSATSFKVTFTPTSPGAKTAQIRIPNNDNSSNPYILNLTGRGLASEIVVRQAAVNILNTGILNVPLTNVGSSTGPIVITIENIGDDTLRLTGTPKIAISGLHATDFTIDESTTKSKIDTSAATQTTTFTINFTPAAAGPRTATISIATNDSDENPFTFTINGTGSTPEINVRQGTTNYLNASTYSFGTFNVGSTVTPVTFTLENLGNGVLNLTGTPNRIVLSGTDAASFTLVQTGVTASVNPGLNVTYTVAFNPTTAGVKNALLTIASNDTDEPSYVINLSGTAVTNPEINLRQGTTSYPSAGNFTFPATTIGSPLPATTFTIENTGNGTLTLSGSPIVAITGANAADFVIVQPTGASIAAAGTSTFTIQFVPTTAGAKTATISIANNDSDENPYTLVLSGTAISPAAPEINVRQNTTTLISGTGTYTFTPAVAVGSSSATVTFTIENTGNAVLNLTGSPVVQITGTEFIVNQTTTGTSVPAAASTTFTITFTPTSAGAKSATVTIANNDSDEGSYTFTVSATATASPEINVKQGTSNILSTGTYAFPSVIAGSSTAPTTFTIENIGNAALTLSALTLSGTDAASFSLTQPAVTSINGPTGTTTFTVTFSPATVGAKTAVLSIPNNDSDENPYTITLTGTATAAPAPEMNLKQGTTVIASGTGAYNFAATPATVASSPVTFTVENIGSCRQLYRFYPFFYIGNRTYRYSYLYHYL
ncbi:MAG: glycosyl hydrolase family 8 [Cytophagaceae bacterium]|nr:glycosyl hydrolase family 8 [Cytophagaceae bacterium]